MSATLRTVTVAVLLLVGPALVRAQQPGAAAAADVCAAAGVSAATARSQAAASPDTVPGSSRQEARRLSAAATQAELLGDEDAAVDLLRRALRADPSSADDRYRLARLLEVKGDTAAAVKDYCRYVALAPDGQDRADAEARLLALAPAAPVDARASAAKAPPPSQAPTESAPSPVVQDLSPQLASPQSVLLRGLLLPGSGQVITGRTPLGFVVGAGVAGAALAGVLTKRISIDCLSEPVDGTCPTGDVARRRVERPLLIPGIAVAAAGTILAAIEAYHYRSRQIDAVAGAEDAPDRRSSRVLPPSASSDGRAVELNVIRIRF